jgi:small subunit ribosomal protein S15
VAWSVQEQMNVLTRCMRSMNVSTTIQTRFMSSSNPVKYVAPPRLSKETHYRFGLRANDPSFMNLVAENPQLKAVLSLSNASQRELNKAQIAKAIEMFQRFPGDTGSSEVQIAVLTQKILRSTTHAQGHKKDHHSRRGLIGMVERRRKLLKYLRREDLQKFRAVVSALGLRAR